MGVIRRRVRLSVVEQFASAGLMMASAIATARWLGPAGKGRYAVLTTIVFFGSVILALGIPQALTTWVSRDDLSRSRALWIGLRVAARAGLVAGAGALGVAIARPEYAVLSAVTAAAITLTVAARSVTAVALGDGDMPALMLSTLVPSAVLCVAMAALAVASRPPSVVAALIVLVVSLPIGVVLGWARLTRLRQAQTVSLPGASRAVGLASFGVRTMLGQLVSAANSRADILLLGVFGVAAAQIGVYSVAVSGVMLLAILPTALTQATVRAFGQDSLSPESIEMTARVVLGTSALAALALVVGTGLLAVPVFGIGFADTTALLIIMAPGMVLYSIVPIVVQYSYSRHRRAETGSIIAGVTVAIDLVLLAVFAPQFEATGAAVASGIAYAVGGLLALWMLQRWTKSSFVNLLLVRWTDWRWVLERDRR